jgi:hypothetical protein
MIANRIASAGKTNTEVLEICVRKGWASWDPDFREERNAKPPGRQEMLKNPNEQFTQEDRDRDPIREW